MSVGRVSAGARGGKDSMESEVLVEAKLGSSAREIWCGTILHAVTYVLNKH